MEKEPLKAINIKLDEAENEGVAYYRITPEFLEFLKKCDEKFGIIGFEYDGSLNFGVILKKNYEPKISEKI